MIHFHNGIAGANYPVLLSLSRQKKTPIYIPNDAQNAIKMKKVCYFLDIPARFTSEFYIFATIYY